jgi:hypothetical protein
MIEKARVFFHIPEMSWLCPKGIPVRVGDRRIIIPRVHGLRVLGVGDGHTDKANVICRNGPGL